MTLRRTPLRPGKPPKRKARLKHGASRFKRTPIKRKAKKRSKSEFYRIYGSEERVKFVASQPCVCCGKEPTQSRPSHNHHVWTDGTGRKGPFTAIVPLCAECHERYHRIGKLSLLQQSKLRVRERGYRNRVVVFTPCETWEDAARKIDRLCDLAGVVVVP